MHVQALMILASNMYGIALVIVKNNAIETRNEIKLYCHYYFISFSQSRT